MAKNRKDAWVRTWVRNIDSGVIFESARAAAISIKVGDSAMSNHLAGRCDSLNGQKFERVPEGTVADA
tara:strand:- start:1041 stop:1244 length:204 start_codon:yes stop_codon:yes gene_type:complete